MARQPALVQLLALVQVQLQLQALQPVLALRLL
jgi:hypothetical protein